VQWISYRWRADKGFAMNSRMQSSSVPSTTVYGPEIRGAALIVERGPLTNWRLEIDLKFVTVHFSLPRQHQLFTFVKPANAPTALSYVQIADLTKTLFEP
jgi:hypothetical protein